MAADDVRIVVVGNPANTNALIASSHAPDIPSERFTAMTRLDHNRALAQIAHATGSPVRDVERMTIWGNHSATQVPDLDQATIAGRPVRDVLTEQGLGEEWVRTTFIPPVAQRGAEIIAVRGGSSVASAAHAALAHVHDWVMGTPDGDWTSMAVVSDGSYGVDEGLISSFPVTCRSGEYEINHSIDVSEDARRRLESSVSELREERDTVRAKGLLGPKAGH